MLDGELAPEVETESITPGSAQLADPSGASVGAGGVTNCRRSNASTRTYSEPEMGFEPMTCALRALFSSAALPAPTRRNRALAGKRLDRHAPPSTETVPDDAHDRARSRARSTRGASVAACARALAQPRVAAHPEA